MDNCLLHKYLDNIFKQLHSDTLQEVNFIYND